MKRISQNIRVDDCKFLSFNNFGVMMEVLMKRFKGL